MPYLPSHYKLPTNHRCPPCLICQTSYLGATELVHIGNGVSVYLCPGHASPEFRRARSGRDFQLSLMKAWQAAGCWDKKRQRALECLRRADQRRAEDEPQRPRPGSYAWPAVRAAVEAACAKGRVAIGQLRRVVEELLSVEVRRGRVKAPSERTLRRWRAERRWEPAAGAAAPGGAAAAAP